MEFYIFIGLAIIGAATILTGIILAMSWAVSKLLERRPRHWKCNESAYEWLGRWGA